MVHLGAYVAALGTNVAALGTNVAPLGATVITLGANVVLMGANIMPPSRTNDTFYSQKSLTLFTDYWPPRVIKKFRKNPDILIISL